MTPVGKQSRRRRLISKVVLQRGACTEPAFVRLLQLSSLGLGFSTH